MRGQRAYLRALRGHLVGRRQCQYWGQAEGWEIVQAEPGAGPACTRRHEKGAGDAVRRECRRGRQTARNGWDLDEGGASATATRASAETAARASRVAG